MASELSAYVNEVFGQPEDDKGSSSPVLFVAPMGNEMPDDGIFKYTTIDNLVDIAVVEERSVIMFTEGQADMLAVLAKYDSLFDRKVQALFAAPGSKYDVWFEDATFGIDRISYGVFVAELRNASEVEAQLREANKSGTDIERDKFSKASGAVRFNQQITAGDDSYVDE